MARDHKPQGPLNLKDAREAARKFREAYLAEYPRAGFLDIDVAKERQRRDRASVVDRQVEDRTQRVHIVLEIKSGGHATRLDRGLGLIGRTLDRLRGKAGRRDIGSADVAQHKVCERIELRLDSGQSVVVHVSPFPAVHPFADSPTREGGK